MDSLDLARAAAGVKGASGVCGSCAFAGTIPGPIPGTSGILFFFLALGLTISMKWPPGLSLQPAITLQAAPVAACDNPEGGPRCSLR